MTDRSRLVHEDYADGSRLSARQSIYAWQHPRLDLHGEVIDRLRDVRGPVVDIGCGNGRYTRALRQARPELSVIGLDLSAGMCPDAVADAQHLPLANRSADGILALHMLYHVPDIPAAVEELARVLTDDGVAVASTNSAAAMPELMHLWLTAGRRAAGADVDPWAADAQVRFALEAAGPLLERAFCEVTTTRFPSVVRVPEVGPVVSYLDSARAVLRHRIPDGVAWPDVLAAARAEVARTIAAEGVFTITCLTAILVCRGPKR